MSPGRAPGRRALVRDAGLALALALALALGLLAWWRLAGPSAGAAAGEPSASAALAESVPMPPPAAEAPPAPPLVLARDPAMPLPSRPAERGGPAAAPTAARAASEAAGWLFVTAQACGYGPVELALPPDPLATASDGLPPAIGAPARAAAWPQLLGAMGASPDPQVRAARWLLQASGAPRQDTPGIAEATLRQERLAAVQALALEAAAGPGAEPWAWAASACEQASAQTGAQAGAQAPSACAGVAPEARVRRLPDHASAWLALAATLPEGSAAQADAMARAAAAPQLGESSAFGVAAAVIEAWPAALPEHLQEQLVAAAIGVQAAMVDPTGLAALRWCVPQGGDTVPAERRGTCEALARRMRDEGRELMSLGLARSLGQRLGWPADEVQAMRSRIDDATRAIADASVAREPLSCASVQALRAWVRDAHRLGERATAQALIDAATPAPVR